VDNRHKDPVDHHGQEGVGARRTVREKRGTGRDPGRETGGKDMGGQQILRKIGQKRRAKRTSTLKQKTGARRGITIFSTSEAQRETGVKPRN